MANGSGISRRKFMGAVGAIAGTTAIAPIVVRAQARPGRETCGPGEHDYDATA